MKIIKTFYRSWRNFFITEILKKKIRNQNEIRKKLMIILD